MAGAEEDWKFCGRPMEEWEALVWLLLLGPLNQRGAAVWQVSCPQEQSQAVNPTGNLFCGCYP